MRAIEKGNIMKRRRFFVTPIAMVGAMFGVSPPAMAQENNGDLRVCPKCEAEKRDWLAKHPNSLGCANTGQIVFCCGGNTEILRACKHRLWFNPELETNLGDLLGR